MICSFDENGVIPSAVYLVIIEDNWDGRTIEKLITGADLSRLVSRDTGGYSVHIRKTYIEQ